MSWIKQNSNLYTHSDAPFSLQYIGSTWYLVDNRDQSKAIPFSDIFNNPAYAIDLSNQDVLVNSLSSASFVNATHLRSETANTPATPGHSFKTEISSGMYRISAGKIGFSSLGNRVGEFGTDYGGFTGNIIQVQNGTKSSTVANASTTYQDSLLNVSITPKYNNSKILIFGNVQGVYNSNGNGGIKSRLTRNNSSIYVITNLMQYDISGISFRNNSFSFSYLDSPATLLSLTYKIEFATYNTGTAILHDYGTELVISTITAMEIQQ